MLSAVRSMPMWMLNITDRLTALRKTNTVIKFTVREHMKPSHPWTLQQVCDEFQHWSIVYWDSEKQWGHDKNRCMWRILYTWQLHHTYQFLPCCVHCMQHGLAWESCPSVCQMRGLWQNERNFGAARYTIWKNDYPAKSSSNPYPLANPR